MAATTATTTAPTSEVVVDGAQLEGGGQLVRNAVALAALLSVQLHIINIRAGRPQSGLRARHCKGIELVCQLSVTGVHVQRPLAVGDTHLRLTAASHCDSGSGSGRSGRSGRSSSASASGSDNGSGSGSGSGIRRARRTRASRVRMHADTAASVCLMLQSALPCALFGPNSVQLELGGGTDVPFAPTVDYMENVFLSVVRRFMNIRCSLKVHRRGMFPQGRGLVEVCVDPVQRSLPSVEMLHRGWIKHIRGACYACGRFPERIAANMAKSAERQLKEKVGAMFQVSPDVHIEVQMRKGPVELQCADSGCVLCLVAESSNGNRFGGSGIVRRKQAEKAVDEAVQQLMSSLSINTCVDQFTQDQLIILMALAEGTSRIRCGALTLHTRTAMSVAQQLTGAVFSVDTLDDAQVILSVDGIGYQFPCDQS